LLDQRLQRLRQRFIADDNRPHDLAIPQDDLLVDTVGGIGLANLLELPILRLGLTKGAYLDPTTFNVVEGGTSS
jgi:hypothetical protein